MPVISGWTNRPQWTPDGATDYAALDFEPIQHWPISFECRRCGYKREFAKNETVSLDPECPHIDLACNAVPK